MKHSPFVHLLGGLVMLVLTAAGYGFWYHMAVRESSQAASLSQQIETKKETAKRASVVQEALAELESDEGAVENYFVSVNNIVTFLGGLESLGSNIGSKVSVASVGAPSGAGQTLSAALSISGSFNAVMRTVGAIEYAPYAITISSLTMTQSAGSSGALWNAGLIIGVGSNATSTPAVTPKAPPTTPTPAPGVTPSANALPQEL